MTDFRSSLKGGFRPLSTGTLIVLLGVVFAVDTLTPPAASAAPNKCTRLLPTGGLEVIINTCNKCRVVNIIRKRPGNAVPVTRSYNVQPNSKITVPFRGPGRSRITSERACKGDPGAAINLADPKPKKKKPAKVCIALEKSKVGGVLLVNTCTVCKAALIERQDSSGGNSKRQAYRVEAKSTVPVPQNGAARVGFLAEVDCP